MVLTAGEHPVQRAVAARAGAAAQVVSGIGLLGGGVILREGFNVRGMNTAATLWCSAAVGTLAGLFFGAWAGFVFKGNALDEVDRKARLRGVRPSPPPASDH